MEKTSIILENLAIGYRNSRGKNTVVAEGITKRVEGGQMTCLLGRNGTGKSTLLRTIAGFQPALEGRVIIGNEDTATASARHMSRLVSVVLTAKPHIYNTTVAGLVALGRTPHTGFWGTLTTHDKEIVNEAMHLTGVADIADRKTCSLSDGQLQRVMVSKALAQQTPVILFDEPTAFLDYPGKNAMMRLLATLAHSENKTILMSTHDIDTAMSNADRIWMMHDKGITDGTPGEMNADGTIENYKTGETQ